MKRINYRYGTNAWVVIADAELCPSRISIEEVSIRETSAFSLDRCVYKKEKGKEELLAVASRNDLFDTREEAEQHLRDLIEQAKGELRK